MLTIEKSVSRPRHSPHARGWSRDGRRPAARLVARLREPMGRREGALARCCPPVSVARGPPGRARPGRRRQPDVRDGAVRLPPPDGSRRWDPVLLHMAHQLDRDGHRGVRGAPRVGHAARRATPR